MASIEVRACWLFVLVMGCGPSVPPFDGSGADSTAEPSTGAPPSSSGTTSTTTSAAATSAPPPPSTSGESTSTTTDGTEGVVFLLEPDGPYGCQCDLFAQDCPRGEKCMPRGNLDSETWDCVRCSPIAKAAGALGDPCTYEGSPLSGIDDCGAGLVCWDVDPVTNQGTCVAMCTGNESLPQCEGSTTCLMANDDVLILCLPPCDPLANTPCPDGEACVPTFDGFACVAAGEAATAGQACDGAVVPYGCAPGLVCALAERVGPSCGHARCCTPLCAVSQGDVCDQDGQTCVSWWDEAAPPAGLEDVGVCAIP